MKIRKEPKFNKVEDEVQNIPTQENYVFVKDDDYIEV